MKLHHAPGASLLAVGSSARRLTVIEWSTLVNTELHQAFSLWLWPERPHMQKALRAEGRIK